MSHFAYVENGVVTKVLVIEQDVIDTGLFGEPSNWIQTSYNTYAGVHRLGGTPLRKNYAGIGYIYDSGRDAFYPPAPSPEYTLDEETCTWKEPVVVITESTSTTTESTSTTTESTSTTTESTSTTTESTTSTSPYPSWIWDEATQSWVAPVPMNDDGNSYTWNEDTQEWILNTVS